MLVQQAKFDPAASSFGVQETNSPVFAALIEIMGKGHKWGILDLGSARSANLEMLSKFRCRLFIEDAHELASALSGNSAEDKAALVHWFEQWAGGVSAESIDVVIAWDIFNYLDSELCRTFVELLMPLLRPGAYIYLSVYSQKDMPALPIRFTIIADDRLEYQPLSKATRPSPRFNQTDLKKRLPQFSIVKSVLLRNGMQEYLFKRTP
jgi:hypothetical protein